MLCVKVKFATQKDADFHIEKKARTQDPKKAKIKASSYFCSFCNNWHITSQTPHKDRIISKLMQKNTNLRREIKALHEVIQKLKNQK